jgi:DNA polymerase I-like protein with 3'-5' exonuclease and polymerase domains
MFDNPVYIEYKNEVPNFWKDFSDQCKPFSLSIPVDKNWKESKKRTLIVCGHVSSEDLKNKRLLSGESLKILRNCFKYAQRMGKAYGPCTFSNSAYAAINFNFFKTYHLTDREQAKTDAESAKRVKDFIHRMNPTHILVIGDDTAKALLSEEIPLVLHKKGWVHKIKFCGEQRVIVNTVEFSDAAVVKGKDRDDSDDEAALKTAYLLGFFSRNIRNFLMEKLASPMTTNPVKVAYVDTIPKFKKMMQVLEAHDKIAFDTETSNLNKIVNRLLIIQFAVNDKYGFVMPYLHKETPFSPFELNYIKKKLRKFFMQKMEMNSKRYLIAYNAKFDLTVVKQALGIPFIYWPVYDAMAGEHTHDETLRFHDDSEVKQGNMAQACCNYGNDFYLTAAFSKKDRGNMDATSLKDMDFLKYCAADGQLLIALHNAQLDRAKHVIHTENGKEISYGKDFLGVVLAQMSNNIQIFANMEHRGVHLDSRFVAYMKTKDSPISKQIVEATKAFNKNKAVKKANDILLERQGEDLEGGLFNIKPWIFNIGKPDHKLVLFIEVLGLKELSKGKNGKASLGKAFKKAYQDIPEVELLNNLEKVKKLKSSYVDAFARQLNEPDGKVDNRLRPFFGFFKVLSGRSNSEKPSLQQVPQHSANAKYIKRMFAPPPGFLIIKMDYSAHEVRGWSIISGDKLLGEVFAIGRKLRQKYFKTGDKKYAKELALKGDVHKLNAVFFFGVKIKDVTKELRNAIKGVVFGAIYGKSHKTLAKELKKDESFTADLYKRFFERFKRAAKWLEWAKSFAKENLFVKSAIGRRRHLFGYLTENKTVMGAMDRRAMNSPIQGLGADFGHTGSRIFEKEIYEYLLKVGEITEESPVCPIGTEIMVHDSIFTSSPFKYVLATAQIMQWCTTMGVQRYYDKHFNLQFTVPVEIEMEFGASQDRTYKWDWSTTKGYDPEIHDWNEELAGKKWKDFPEDKRIKEGAYNLDTCIRLALKDNCEMYKLVNFDKAYKEIYSSWNDSKMKKYLDEKFPILSDYEK